MKEIKDYLHLYLWCMLKTEFGQSVLYADNIYRAKNLNWKPILRPLSDITEEEEFEMTEITGLFIGSGFIKAIKENSKYVIDVRNSFEVTRYLLSKHFDLFNLIEEGLAIDKTKIKS